MTRKNEDLLVFVVQSTTNVDPFVEKTGIAKLSQCSGHTLVFKSHTHGSYCRSQPQNQNSSTAPSSALFHTAKAWLLLRHLLAHRLYSMQTQLTNYPVDHVWTKWAFHRAYSCPTPMGELWLSAAVASLSALSA
eukprot:939809-Amphidinium_carterae.1